jgi:hypothetical protein
MAQRTFDITASADDTWLLGSGASWPPAYSVNQASDASIVLVKRGSDNALALGLLRFDTSELPNGSDITAGTLRVDINNLGNNNARSITAEYYTWSPPGGSSDFTATEGTDALSPVLIQGGWGAGVRDFPLDGLSGINTSGYTGMRLHISGGAPTGENIFSCYAFDDATHTGPQLIIDYEPPATETLRPDAIITQTNDTKTLADLQRDVV